MLNPDGRPVAVNVSPIPVPPLAVIVTGVIATPCVALIVTQLDMIGGVLITMLQWICTTCPFGFVESVTVTVYVKLPYTVGVPVIAPVVAFIDNPAGSPVAAYMTGATPPVTPGPGA